MPDGTNPTRPNSATIPRIRTMDFSFDGVPRRWFYDSVWITASTNALNLLFPAGERFFVRSVKYYLSQIHDPTLRARVRGFFGQEGSHGHEHQQLYALLEGHGYTIRPWLRWYEQWAYDRMESRLPPILRLSMTAALEHLTAALAEVALTTTFLDHAHPALRDLARWHAAEELEHKSVAFDVLQQIDPRYWVRVAGMVGGSMMLLGFWGSGIRMLLRQEPNYTSADLRRERRTARARGQDRMAVYRAIGSYFRPNFHPNDHDTDALYRRYLRSIGRLER